ncbi:GNAT family N-acetyltransferase [Inhella proteolytica]|uniref:GNAT family N-acetyltransferase n=1 Tax=Inhella proteolytica TaxID=2795029 RepID=A0A931J3C1_9BURK|nr:GNAT family N-acetyltransferase [Inhella proteolytica]MBH9577420.1 GNAT family N-acetyltransferase [Inhella proteolytica]
MQQIERGGRRYTLSSDPAALDVDAVHAMLSRAYWCEGIPREVVAKAMAHSLAFSLWCEEAPRRQVGIARWVTDRATFAYLCDVFLHEDHRGLGLGDWLVGQGLQHPDLQGLRRQVLFTADMHALYARHGFTPLKTPERGMEIVRPNLYKAKA